MMTDVVVAPSLEELLVVCVLLLTEAVRVVVIASFVWGLVVVCVLLLTGAVPVVVIAPLVWGGRIVAPTRVGVDAVDRKHTSCHFATKGKGDEIRTSSRMLS